MSRPKVISKSLADEIVWRQQKGKYINSSGFCVLLSNENVKYFVIDEESNQPVRYTKWSQDTYISPAQRRIFDFT